MYASASETGSTPPRLRPKSLTRLLRALPLCARPWCPSLVRRDVRQVAQGGRRSPTVQWVSLPQDGQASRFAVRVMRRRRDRHGGRGLLRLSENDFALESRETFERSMEAGGIEPPSAVAPGRASTSVVCALISPGRPVRRRPTAGPALLLSHPSGEWLSFGASPLSDAGSLTTGRVRGDASPNYLGSECEILIRTYVFPVDLRGRPGTSACSSAGEPTTSKPGRPRMCSIEV